MWPSLRARPGCSLAMAGSASQTARSASMILGPFSQTLTREPSARMVMAVHCPAGLAGLRLPAGQVLAVEQGHESLFAPPSGKGDGGRKQEQSKHPGVARLHGKSSPWRRYGGWQAFVGLLWVSAPHTVSRKHGTPRNASLEYASAAVRREHNMFYCTKGAKGGWS